MNGKFKEGDRVFYHSKPGEVDSGIIRDLAGCRKDDLFETREEAEAELSPDGKRLAGCLTEAEAIYGDRLVMAVSVEYRHEQILTIAFKLFNAGGD